jgi:hypothetical protein
MSNFKGLRSSWKGSESLLFLTQDGCAHRGPWIRGMVWPRVPPNSHAGQRGTLSRACHFTVAATPAPCLFSTAGILDSLLYF